MAYSADFRQGVIDACDRGETTKEVAQTFGVAASWVRRLKQWRRERGSIMPRPCGGSSPKLGPNDEAKIHAHFRQHPDTTIAQLQQALNTDVSEITVWRTARRLGYRFKKSRSMPPSSIAKTSSSGGKTGRNRPAASIRQG